jgi:hypothetical protein
MNMVTGATAFGSPSAQVGELWGAFEGWRARLGPTVAIGWNGISRAALIQ